ncbi:MAG: helix-turn-helix domain-containing protein [Clostridiales bacterium]|nr:helix-turn-helix domain-containing protein [Clostridiales bacterium]
MDKNDVVVRISTLRTKAGLSARELSLRIGKNSAYISRLESQNDSFEPSISALLEIIAACNSTESEFFYYDPYAYAQDKEIIELLKAASPTKKAAIICLLKN